MAPERIEGLREADEVTGNKPRALVDELIERVLPIGAGLAPVDRAGFAVDVRAIEGDVLAVGLHGELLEVRGVALEVLLVRQHRDRLCVEEVGIPEGEET